MPCGLATAYPLIRCRLAGRYMTAFCNSVVLLRRVTNRLWLLQPYLRAHFILTQRGKKSGLAEAIDCSEQEEATAKPFSHVHKLGYALGEWRLYPSTWRKDSLHIASTDHSLTTES